MKFCTPRTSSVPKSSRDAAELGWPGGECGHNCAPPTSLEKLPKPNPQSPYEFSLVQLASLGENVRPLPESRMPTTRGYQVNVRGSGAKRGGNGNGLIQSASQVRDEPQEIVRLPQLLCKSTPGSVVQVRPRARPWCCILSLGRVHTHKGTSCEPYFNSLAEFFGLDQFRLMGAAQSMLPAFLQNRS